MLLYLRGDGHLVTNYLQKPPPEEKKLQKNCYLQWFRFPVYSSQAIKAGDLSRQEQFKKDVCR